MDESGFYLLPAVVRTYAPVGQTPMIRHKLTYEHLSAMSGITPKGDLYLAVQEQSYKAIDVVAFLKHLLRHIPGKLLVVWDGAPIHRSQVVKDYLAGAGATRIHLECLPPYAPELNPDEGIWNYLKGVELRNLCCQGRAQLLSEFRKAVKRLRHKRYVIRGCFNQTSVI